MKKIILYILLVVPFLMNAQNTPAPKQSESILIIGATAHLGTGEAIENSAIGFENGKITFVGTADKADKTAFATIINATGKDVYPGFIAPNNQLGLVEIEAVRATRDDREVGFFNPNIRSIIAYNTDSKVTPTIRSNGVLLSQITPQGGRISGQSSVVQLDAWNWEDATVNTDEGIWMSWPRYYTWTGWWAEPGEIKMNDDYNEQVQAIKDYFKEAKAYANAQPSDEKNLKFEAMKGLFLDGEKSKTLYVRVDFSKAMMEVVNFAKAEDIEVVLVGANDAWMITDFLKENDISLIISQTHRLPSREDEDVDMPFKTPKILSDAGINFALSINDMWQQRNLPFQAGHAVGYGLDYEKAVQAVTLNPAEIMGIEDTYGSLETGKSATLFISKGDVLDMRTCEVEQAFIDGREIDLNNKHKALYEKFKAKYDRQ
ncbi:MAG: amidohydrolase family protein [Saprospiraceae bacterium]|jgi:imidazolonepropionase-like amidohydrolase